MRRNKGLFITIIVIIILLVATLVGLVLYKFVFNKDKTKPNNQGQVVDNPQGPTESKKEELKIGDYIEYTPDEAENYVLEGTATGVANNSLEGVKQEKLKWRILNINADGTIDIISEEPIRTEVYFGGALGFNNAVYLLNDMCKELYSNKSLDAEARSINLEDIENKMSNIALTERDEYENNDITYGELIKYNNISAPEIVTKTNEESNDYYEETTTNTFIPQTEISIKNTFYGFEDTTEDYFEDEEFYKLIFETENGYWLATRCADCSGENATFGLRSIEEKSLTGELLCTSKSKSNSGKSYVRPVVTLGKNVEISAEGGTEDEPRTIKGGTSQTERPNPSGNSGIKIDEDKDLVYDAEYTYGNLEGKSYTAEDGEKYSIEEIKVPFINIDSSDAEKANKEIKTIFEEAAKIFEKELEGEKSAYVTAKYEMYENDEKLSITIKTELEKFESFPNIVYYTYNFDLTDGSKLSYEDIYNIANISESEIDEKVEEAITEELEYRWKGLAEGYEDELDEYTEKTIENYKKSVSNNTIKYFLDEEQKLNIMVALEAPTLDGTFEAVITIE